MKRDFRIKAFIGNSDEIDDLCHFLRNNGVKSADLAWAHQTTNEVIKVDVRDYAEAVMLGSIYTTEKGYKRVVIVSLANQKLNQVEDTANYARYKLRLKGSIQDERE